MKPSSTTDGSALTSTPSALIRVAVVMIRSTDGVHEPSSSLNEVSQNAFHFGAVRLSDSMTAASNEITTT